MATKRPIRTDAEREALRKQVEKRVADIAAKAGDEAKLVIDKARDDPEQSKRFEDAAKQIGTDETGAAFERAIGVVVPPAAPKPPSSS